jgi:tripartite-type tricarboxylate transporter receptor subunit TctC
MYLKKIGILLTLMVSVIHGQHAVAQDFPNKPIRMVVGFPPGGGIDQLARLLAEGMSSQLGQNIIVDNKPGAGTAIASAEIMRATNDGYTIGLGNVGQFSVLEHISKQPIVDLPSKLAPIGQVGYAPLALFVPATLSVNSVTDYLNLLKSQPNTLSYGSGGNGQITHLAFEMLKSETQVKIQHIPYKGSGPALIDLMAGRVVGIIDALGAGMPHVKSGKLKVLALTAAERAPEFQSIPTFKESGLKNYVVTGWQGMVAPLGTPSAVLQKLNRSLNETLNKKEIREKMIGLGYYPTPTSAEQFGSFMKAESLRWGALCKELKIETD